MANNNINRGHTWAQNSDYNMNSFWMFRQQEVRTLKDVDQLYARKQKIGARLGSEHALAIEEDSDLYYDFEKLRIW